MILTAKKWTADTIRTETERIIRSIMKSYEKEELGDQIESFFSELDSLRMIELVVLTEKRFKIQFTPSQLESLGDQKMSSFLSVIEKAVLEG